MFTPVARTAGKFKVRGVVVINGFNFYSIEKDLNVQFPNLDQILAGIRANGQSLLTAFNIIWESTVAATEDGSRREEGCFITLNTATGFYEITPIPTLRGEVAGNDEGAEIEFKDKPFDNPQNPCNRCE